MKRVLAFVAVFAFICSTAARADIPPYNPNKARRPSQPAPEEQKKKDEKPKEKDSKDKPKEQKNSPK